MLYFRGKQDRVLIEILYALTQHFKLALIELLEHVYLPLTIVLCKAQLLLNKPGKVFHSFRAIGVLVFLFFLTH